MVLRLLVVTLAVTRAAWSCSHGHHVITFASACGSCDRCGGQWISWDTIAACSHPRRAFSAPRSNFVPLPLPNISIHEPFSQYSQRPSTSAAPSNQRLTRRRRTKPKISDSAWRERWVAGLVAQLPGGQLSPWVSQKPLVTGTARSPFRFCAIWP